MFKTPNQRAVCFFLIVLIGIIDNEGTPASAEEESGRFILFQSPTDPLSLETVFESEAAPSEEALMMAPAVTGIARADEEVTGLGTLAPVAHENDVVPSEFDDSPAHSFVGFLGYDSWHGHPDGAWGNNGIHMGFNYGTRLGRFSDWTRIGAQIGGSVGVYNWSGSNYRMSNNEQATTQGFVTYGLFRRACVDSPWSFAVAHDLMINHNYSVMGEDMTLGQVRAEVGYAVDDQNEFGIWGARHVQSDTRNVAGFGPVTWRPINQFNPYWHHKWGEYGADTWVWVGVPEQDRLTGGGSLGDYIVGLFADCPLGERVSLYAMVNYMHPSAAPGPAASAEEAWNFYTGLSFDLRRNAMTRMLQGQTWTPLLPVANNGLLLVDASASY